MKKIILALITVFVFTSCQQQKIAYMDNGKVINEYQGKIEVEEKFKALDDVFKRKTDSIAQAFQLEAQAFQLEAEKLSQTKAQEKYQALTQKQQYLQQQTQFEQQQMQQAFQVEIDSAIIKVKAFVKDYGKKNGYTYILGTSDAAASVLYGTEENDLTEIIIEALNASYKK
ncbi:OmpH family outer membrane protein [Lacinutrix iliipiscaria]|uniref:OmpH family outer membrane protein n=1 Tax=Lacinutrix iliipiscaria TaxID=1230532 RepID=A0ABW5WJW5_9FLAO